MRTGQFRASARGPINMDGSPVQGGNIAFSLDDGARVNKDATLALHKQMELRHRRRLEDVGIKIKPYSKEEIEKRAMAGIEWQKDGDKEAEKENGGACLYESDLELCEKRGVDVKELRAAEHQVTELRAVGVNRYQPFHRRMLMVRGLDGGTDTALIGVDYAHEFYRDLRLAGRLGGLFQQIDLPQGYATMTLPIIGDMQYLLQGALTSEAFTVNTAVDPDSTTFSIAPKKFQGIIFWSGEFDEDALAPVLPGLEESAKRGANVLLDHLILNGDTVTTTANINARGASATALGSKDPRLAFNGVRAMNFKGTDAGSSAGVFGGVDGASGTIALNNLLTAQGAMGKWADDPKQTATIMPTGQEKKLLQDTKARPDTYSQLLEVEGGKLKSVGGSRVVTLGNSVITDASSSNVPNYASWMSEGYPVNLNASGVYDAVTTTETGFTVIAPSNFRLGFKRRWQMQVVDLPLGDQKAITCSLRVTLVRIIDNEGTAVGFNFDS